MSERESSRPFIESPLAGFLLAVPAFAAWGAVLASTLPRNYGAPPGKDFLLPLGFSLFAFLCAAGSGAYSLLRALKRAGPHPAFPLACLVAGISMFAATVFNTFLWHWSDGFRLLAAFGSCVPPVAYALALLADRSLEGLHPYAPKEIIAPAAIAALWLLFGGAFLFGRGWGWASGSATGLVAALMLGSFLVSGFCVARAGFALSKRVAKTASADAGAAGAPGRPSPSARPPLSARLPRILFCLLLPLAGIALSALAVAIAGSDASLLAFLHDPLVVALAAASGIALCLPEPRRLPLRLALACLRAAFFPFTAYIALLFLPFMPAIPFTVFLFGAGLLLALPACDFVCHFSALRADFRALKAGFKPAVVAIALCLSCLVLPLLVAGQALFDRFNLGSAIAWVRGEEPGESRSRIDAAGVRRGLRLGDPAGGYGGYRNEVSFPLLDSLRAGIIMEGKRLSDSMEALLRAAFGDSRERYPRLARNANSGAAEAEEFSVSARLVSSGFDPAYGLMRARIELRPVYEGASRVGEFSLGFSLPKAAWLRDFYLYVGNEKRPGRIFMTSAATAVYSSILRRSRDPGLLSLSEDNRASLRVFPFSAGQERRTGFDLLYADAFSLKLGQARIDLPAPPGSRREQGPGWLVGAPRLAALPAFRRRPYLQFIVEASFASLADKGALAARIESALGTELPDSPVEALPARLSFVDYEERTSADSLSWRAALDALQPRGGFLPYRAIASMALRAAKDNPYAFPVFILLGPGDPGDWSATQPEPYPQALARLFPETEGVYALDGEGRLRLLGESGAEPVAGIAFHPVARLMGAGKEWIARRDEAAFLADQDSADPFERLVAARERIVFTAKGRSSRSAEILGLSKESGFIAPGSSAIVLETDPEYGRVGAAEKWMAEKGEEAFTELGVSEAALASVLLAAAIARLLYRWARAGRRAGALVDEASG